MSLAAAVVQAQEAAPAAAAAAAPESLAAVASAEVATTPEQAPSSAPAQVPVPVQPLESAPAAPAAPAALAVVPLPPEQATERALGARCPVDLAGRLATQGDLLIGACEGLMPAHLAALLVAVPEQDIHLPRSWRERRLRQKVWFKAVPGYG
ncbi:hypothetical protein [Stenotrophomonas maltophilia]|uniref:hypothetical protein n=1 Tax=Stenotrophomonas maltophilia TaxID=40324 RepID=UPI0021C85592|nr:hypothetical protein [Stenotrophomonas maltophilia]